MSLWWLLPMWIAGFACGVAVATWLWWNWFPDLYVRVQSRLPAARKAAKRADDEGVLAA